MKEANLTFRNPYDYNWAEDGVRATLRDMRIRDLTGRYMRIAVYPFGEEAEPVGELRYMAFFAEKDSAEKLNEKLPRTSLKT